VDDICFVRFGTGVQELCPFFNIVKMGVYSSQSVIVVCLIDSYGLHLFRH